MCYGMVKIEHLLPVKRGHLVSIFGQEKFLSGPLSSILGRLFFLCSQLVVRTHHQRFWGTSHFHSSGVNIIQSRFLFFIALHQWPALSATLCGTTLLFTWMNIIHFGSPLFACSLSPHVARIVSDSFIRMNIIESRFSFPLSLYEGSSEMFFVSNVVFSFITMNIIHSGPSSFALSLRREGAAGTHRQRRWSFVASSPALSSRRNCVLSRIQLRRRSSLEASDW